MTEVSAIAVEDVVVGLWQALSRRDWDGVKTFLTDAVKGKKSEKEISKRVRQMCQEDEKSLFLEARDSANKDAVIHRSYLKK